MQIGAKINPAVVASPPGEESCSVLILTRDEEANIGPCLECCLAFSDDFVVLDSFSTDRTVEIAGTYPNVRVIQRKFDTEYIQRNFGLHDISFRHPWVYICDADERVPQDLAHEITATINIPNSRHAAYRVRYENMFRQKWIRFASGYPVWLVRLVRPMQVNYEVRETNVHPIVDGSVGELKQRFIHYSFNKGLAHWFDKHNFYSAMEARAAMKVTQGSASKWFRTIWTRDRFTRRRSIKNFSFFLPGRWILRFFHIYFIRFGFLDGTAGLHYAAMISMYEYWIELKIRELRSDWRGMADRFVAQELAEPGGESPAITQNSPVAVMIPTLNEADHIREVVANALSVGPVMVLDSGSTDGTQEMAREAGATVIVHPFVNYAVQKNWGLDNLPFNADWIFILDADERITPALRAEVHRLLRGTPASSGYFVNRLPMFMGQPTRHGGMYPSWNLRLLRRGECRYENRPVHEHMLCKGPTAYLKGEMLHIRREDLTRYIAKHIRYADMESSEWVKMRLGESESAPPLMLFPGALGWRQWIRRRVLPRLPGSPIWRVIFMYILRLGFLDGKAGRRLAGLMACYEYMIVLLYNEKRMARKHPESADAVRQPA